MSLILQCLSRQFIAADFNQLRKLQHWSAIVDSVAAQHHNYPEILSSSQCNLDPDGLVALCLETVLQKGKSVIVFAPTKKWCETACDLISEALRTARNHLSGVRRYSFLDVSAEKQRQEACALACLELADSQAGLCPILARTLQNGVSYHHAGLTGDERKVGLIYVFRE